MIHPYSPEPEATLPPLNSTMSFGNTGISRPKPMTASTSVTKMNFVAGCRTGVGALMARPFVQEFPVLASMEGWTDGRFAGVRGQVIQNVANRLQAGSYLARCST